ncbi:MAG: hypothetical protein ACE5FD_03675 [Anaerolineae bacterium]
MDKRDVSADQVGVAARKAGIKMLPSIGKPDLQVAADVLLPLLLQGLAAEERVKLSGNLLDNQQAILKAD